MREQSIHGQFKEEKGRVWRPHTSLGTWQKSKNELRRDCAKDKVAGRGTEGTVNQSRSIAKPGPQDSAHFIH